MPEYTRLKITVEFGNENPRTAEANWDIDNRMIAMAQNKPALMKTECHAMPGTVTDELFGEDKV